MKTISVSIVIPNWNGKALLEKYLPQVIEASAGNDIYVVDDGSTDDSVSFLKRIYPYIHVIEKPTHEGFASCVGLGVGKANSDIVVLLNTDVSPEANFLAPLVKPFEDANVFAVGCLEKSHEKGNIITRGRGLARWIKGFYIHSRGEVNQSSTAWVSGGSGAFRKDIWMRLGGMSPLFNPFYWEDIDMSYRARKAGFSVLFEKNSIVHHYHGEGKIKNKFTASYVKAVAFRNQLLFTWLNVSSPKILLEHMLWMPVRIVQSLGRGDATLLSGFLRACSMIHKVLRERAVRSSQWKLSDDTIVTNIV
jgi:GT2 family glycosyltransferase